MSNGAYAPDKILAHPQFLKVLREGGHPYPLHLNLIISDLCDLDCPGCAYRLSGYTSNQLFPGVNGERNPNRMLEPTLVRSILDDCVSMGTRGVEFSVWGGERIPVIDRYGRTHSMPIAKFVDGFFDHAPSGHESIDTSGRGWRAFAIGDDGAVVSDEVTAVYRHPTKEPLYEVTLLDGRSAIVTASHSLNAIRNDAIQKIPVSELAIGDSIACAAWSAWLDASKSIAVPEYTGEKAHQGKLITDPVSVCAELFRFLGYFTAEGCVSGNATTFVFGNGPREDTYRADVRLCARVLFGLEPSDVADSEHVVFSSWKLARLLEQLGAAGTQSARAIPSLVWNTTPEMKLEYLCGLFSGDGCFRSSLDSRGYRRNSLHLKTCNRGLAHEVVALLAQCGVVASVHSGTNKARTIEGRALAPSAYYIVNVHRRDALARLAPVLARLNATASYVDSPYSGRGNRHAYAPFGREAWAVPIKSIRVAYELGRPVVYDITVGNTHRFLTTAGIGAFNTGGGEPTIHPQAPELLAYAQGRGLDTALITNGLHLPRMEDAAVKTTWLRVSLDAATPATYGAVRPGLGGPRPENFLKALRNIEWAVRRKRDLKLLCTIGIGFVVQKANWRELRDAVALAFELGVDNVRVSGLFTPEGDAYHASYREEATELERQAVAEFDCERFRVHGRFGEKLADLAGPPKRARCWYQETTSYIGADANLYRCCVISYNRRGLLGSVRETGGFKALLDGLDKPWALVGFDARGCERCQFNDRMDAIEAAVTSPEPPKPLDLATTPHAYFI